MKINKILIEVLNEQVVLQGTRTKPIVNAIKNKNPITFYYSGPRKPKKDSVKPGTRIRAEIVAIGLSKKGNLIVRGWVQPPSVSKRGFEEHGWRTFMVSRMSNIQILTDETFDTKRPKYKEGNDKSMSVTYVTSDWTTTPTVPKKQELKPSQKPTELPQPKQKEKPSKEPEQLPQPRPDEKPSKEPEVVTNTKFDIDVYNSLKSKIKDVSGKKTVSTQDYQNSLNDLYKKKETEWVDNQKKIGGNTKPGEGTRNKFKKDSKFELDKLLSNDKVEISDEQENQLQEMVNRFKSLISY
jgi:hypothetical protein